MDQFRWTMQIFFWFCQYVKRFLEKSGLFLVSEIPDLKSNFFFDNLFIKGCLEVINYTTDDGNDSHFYDLFFNEPNQNDARQKMLAYAKNTAIKWPEIYTNPGNYFKEFNPGKFLTYLFIPVYFFRVRSYF